MTPRIPMISVPLLFALLGLALPASPGCSGSDGVEPVPSSITFTDAPSAGACQSAHEVGVLVTDNDSLPMPGVDVAFRILRGGGRVSTNTATTDADGIARASWTMGRMPVLNRIEARIRETAATSELRPSLDVPYAPEAFGDVAKVLGDAGNPGTTEGLDFPAEGDLHLAAPGTLITVDSQGNATLRGLSGDPLEGPLGMAFDSEGHLWIADSTGRALRKISPEGVVSTVVTSVDEAPLGQPNDVVLAPDGTVYFSDPCLGAIFAHDPTLDTTKVVARFNLADQGGPNGLAVDPSGDSLWATTESVGLLCMNPEAGLTDPVAGLYRIDLTGTVPAPADPVIEGVALFGDGLAFDAEGNLYVLFDTIDEGSLSLAESALWVLPDGSPPAVKVLSVDDRVMANLRWGRGAFGDTTIYLSLLAIPAFGLDQRGLVRLDAGIPGASR
jgi:hypothetical protein